MCKEKFELPRPSEFQFCCGTSCDAEANMKYVQQLESKLIDLEDRNLHLIGVNTHLSDKIDLLSGERDLLRKGITSLTDSLVETQAKCTERGMTIKARDRALRILRAQYETQQKRHQPIRFIHPDHMG